MRFWFITNKYFKNIFIGVLHLRDVGLLWLCFDNPDSEISSDNKFYFRD